MEEAQASLLVEEVDGEFVKVASFVKAKKLKDSM